ncbi:MAG: MFS transporter [Pseudomonadota bacterium]
MDRVRTDWKQVTLIWVIGLLAAAQFGKVSLAFDLVRETFARPDPQLAFLVSGVGLVGIGFGAVAGMVAARFAPRRVLLVALVAGGALSVIQAAIPGFWALIGLRVIEGLAHLAIVVACPVLMASAAASRDRPIAMALWASFFGVSFALTAQIIPLFDSLRAVFLAHGVALWVCLPFAWLWITKTEVQQRPWHGLIATHLAIYSDAARVAPALAFFWHTLVFVALLTFLPEQLTGPLSQPIIAGVLPLAALVGTFGAGWLARYAPPLRLCVISFVSSIVLFGLLLPLSGLPQIGVAMVLMVSLGMVPGAAFAAIPALNPDAGDQAEANGAMAQLGNVGTASGTPIFALALGAAGLAGLAAVTIAFCLLGIVAVLWVARRVR